MDRYKLIIFDFDGTLADTFPWFSHVFNTVADRYKFKKISPDEEEFLRSSDSRTILKYLGIRFWKIPLIANHMRTLMSWDRAKISLFEGVDRLLRSLSQEGICLALISSNSVHNVRTILGPDKTVLFRYYECGVSLFGKAAKLNKILRKSDVKRSETLYIADEIRDIQAARKVNISIGSVAWGYNSVESLRTHEPDFVFNALTEILEKIILS